MIRAIRKPFIATWNALVSYHRTHMADDPEVARLREKRKESERAAKRLNIIEQEYLRGRRHGRA